MRVLIALARFTLGGTETYSVTVAEQLERLGHTVSLLAGEANDGGRRLAALRGIRLDVGEEVVPGDADVALVQDAASAYRLADRVPDLRQVCAVHGLAAYEHPPAGLGPAQIVIVFSERMARHVAAFEPAPEIVRMRQPIDLERFRPRGPSRPRARRVLALSNYLNGDRLRMLEDVCGDLDLELKVAGAAGTPTTDPQAAIAQADIVVGYGRSLLAARCSRRWRWAEPPTPGTSAGATAG
jgi:hypothetical protein